MLRILTLALMMMACGQKLPHPGRADLDADSLAAYIGARINPIFNYNRGDSAAPILDSLKPIVDRLNNFKTTCLWLRMYALVKEQAGELDSSQLLIQQAMEIAKKEDSTQRELLGAKIHMAMILKAKNQIDSAVEFGEQAYYLANRIDTSAIPLIAIKLSELYLRTGNLPATRRVLEDGLRRSVKSQHKAVLTFNLARYFESAGKFDSSIAVLKLLEKNPGLPSPHFISAVQENLGVTYALKKDYRRAVKYQVIGLENSKLTNTDAPESYYNVASTYFYLHEYGRSLKYLDTAAKKSIAEKNLPVQRKSQYMKGRISQQWGRYKKSSEELDSAYNLFFEETDSKIFHTTKDIETRYQVRAKNDQISSLTRINKMAETARAQQLIIIYGLAFCVILVGLIGYMLVKRRKLWLQLKEAHMQQQVLRSQMEPHYIFNTISVAQGIVRSGDKAKAGDFLSRFGRLLRISLENARQSLVPLEAEINALDNYLALQAMQFPGTFSYILDVYDGYELDSVLIPPMLIQPFVENAIMHGIRGLKDTGHVSVAIDKVEEYLICKIEDNGRGMETGMPEHSKRSLSTVITKERLDLLAKQTGKKAALEITDKQTAGAGTGILVNLKIPYYSK